METAGQTWFSHSPIWLQYLIIIIFFVLVGKLLSMGLYLSCESFKGTSWKYKIFIACRALLFISCPIILLLPGISKKEVPYEACLGGVLFGIIFLLLGILLGMFVAWLFTMFIKFIWKNDDDIAAS